MRNVNEVLTEQSIAETDETFDSKKAIQCIRELAQIEKELDAWWRDLPLERRQEICNAEKDERCLVLPDMPQDIGDVLEPLKLESALRSEIRKLEFRQANRPGVVSILDYTIIAALKTCLDTALKGGQ